MAEARAWHGGRGAQAAKVWAAWAVLFVLSAVAFTGCFHATYMAVLGRANAWAFDYETPLRQRWNRENPPRETHSDEFDSIIEKIRRYQRLYAYGLGSDFRWQWERPGNNMANVYHWTAILFVLLCPPVAVVLLRFARSRMQLSALDEDERTFQLRVVMRLAVPLLLLAAAAGVLAAAGLTGTRLLQIHYQADFNDSMVASEQITYDRDYLGRGLATLISCAAMLAIVTWGIYPFFARRALRQLGRCAKCAYPRGDTTTCPECGSSHA